MRLENKYEKKYVDFVNGHKTSEYVQNPLNFAKKLMLMSCVD